ncbi:hypothetical protein GF407_00275 [candidate division KSB1 bacterium]|nr:hypothetical protein [candidate division KSB1 bacterium]
MTSKKVFSAQMVCSLFFVFMFAFCLPLNAADRYPEWFIYPQKYDGIVVGYNYYGLSALEDAAYMYYAYRDCIVKGHLEIFDVPGKHNILKNSNYYYWFSDDAVAGLQQHLIKLDDYTFDIITGDHIAAFATDSSVLVSDSVLHRNDLPRPEWVDRFYFKNGDYHYGVGMYTAAGRENDGWKTAEEQGIFTILNNLAVKVHRLLMVNNDCDVLIQHSVQDILFVELYYHLQNIEIVERYPDAENDLYYALVRIPDNSIYSPMLKD